jgi:hypothetical protein
MKLVKSVTPAVASSWIKPQLVELGQIGDVAGNNTINGNGVGNNQKS